MTYYKESINGTRIVFIGSTKGGVLSKIAQHSLVRQLTLEAISDRDCGFIEAARAYGIPAHIIAANNGLEFSNALNDRYKPTDNTIFISFYTRLLKGEFVQKRKGRIFNCHPSILPAFKGLRGFEETIESSSQFMGSTIHIVDEEMDSGPTVIQAAVPIDRSLPIQTNRHKVFLTQYYSTLQLIRWISDDRLTIDSDPQHSLTGASYSPSIFSPNLDQDFFEFIGEENELL